jgi:hypothetical protein
MKAKTSQLAVLIIGRKYKLWAFETLFNPPKTTDNKRIFLAQN